ncbi:MAG: VCBS repeat-containing protein [Anaerolineae bacterium]|nr:VCBS repeat-containing protein [Anaerolineae bacterium]
MMGQHGWRMAVVTLVLALMLSLLPGERETSASAQAAPVLFVDSGQRLGNRLSYDVALGDLDGDGDLDAVVANANQPNEVWINDGAGVFELALELGDAPSRAIALGDLNGDGHLDIWEANTGEPDNIWINDGTADFSAGQAVGTSQSVAVALGDLDGDGDLDAFIGNREESNHVWINQGGTQGGVEGTFVKTTQDLGGSTFSYGIALGDLDDDGDLDVVVVNVDNTQNRVYLNDGTGWFTDTGQNLGTGEGLAVALGDLNGDGSLDAFIANRLQANRVWFNNGEGEFTDSGQALGAEPSYGVDLGDLDGDGDLDAFVANYLTSENQPAPNTVWLNNGAGVFTVHAQPLGMERSLSVALGDLNGAGALDAFIANGGAYSEPNTVWFNRTCQIYLPLVLRNAGGN